MILEFHNLLSEKELDFLNTKCIDFDNGQFEKIDKKTSSNYYNRVFISNDILNEYYSNLKISLKSLLIMINLN